MAMKLLAFHDQFVADFSPDDDQDNNFFSFDIYTGHAGLLPEARTRPKDWDATA
jgi:hypothetical protein